MKALTGISIVVAAAVLSGCVLPRTGGRLAAAKQPSERTAILPVCALDNSMASGSSNDLVQVGNAVLKTLASGRNSLLIPPAQTEAIIKSNSFCDELFHGILSTLRVEGPGEQVSTNVIAGMARLEAFAVQTGIKRMVRTRISIMKKPVSLAADQGGVGGMWGGRVYVQMALLDLPSAKVLAVSEGTEGYDQTAGAFVWMIPVWWGTTQGRAVDKAARQAMVKLFDQQRPISQSK